MKATERYPTAIELIENQTEILYIYNLYSIILSQWLHFDGNFFFHGRKLTFFVVVKAIKRVGSAKCRLASAQPEPRLLGEAKAPEASRQP